MWAVEARAGGRLPDAELQRLRERLAGCAGEVVVDEDGIRFGFRLPAERLTEAVAEALTLLGGQLTIVRLSVMTLAELQWKRERNQLPDVVGIVDIQELAGLGSKQRALQVTRLPTFPAPALETRAGRLWTRTAVEEFLSRWPRRSGRPRKGGGPETMITRDHSRGERELTTVYRYIEPDSPKRASLRMLFQPAGDGIFFKACEADSWRGLVAAILNDPDYETADIETRLVSRLRLADDIVLLGQLGERTVQVADHDGPDTVNVHSDEPFIRSLHRLGFVSLPPEPLAAP